jgi:SAM-dependent methyltransferase
VQASGQHVPAAAPFRVWETAGLTEHMGGVAATRRLIEHCRVGPGQRVLDLGCGTGYTALLLARDHGAQVMAIDINQRLVETARQRAVRAGVGDRVAVLRADAHAVPAGPGSFDVVIVESVLVFCRALQALAEIWRVLRPGGVVGINELTLREPPEALRSLLRDGLHIQPREEREWRACLQRAGFAGITASVAPIRLGEQLRSHLIVDGPRAYLAAVSHGLADPALRRVFCTRAMLRAARLYRSCVGYGIYVATKAGRGVRGATDGETRTAEG